MNNPKISVVATLLLAVSACQSGIEPVASSTSVPIQVVYRDTQCLTDTARIVSIKDAAALADWWQPLAKQRLPIKPLPQSLAAIDFDQSAVFIVCMGARSTAGYDIELQGDNADVERETLTIPASWRQPSTDTVLAQVMTSPCVVLAVPGGPYENVTVRNQHGETLLTTTRPSSRN